MDLNKVLLATVRASDGHGGPSSLRAIAVLSLLCQHRTMTVGEIYKECWDTRDSKAALSRTIKALQNAGEVCTVINSEDRRRIDVFILPRGEERVRQFFEHINSLL